MSGKNPNWTRDELILALDVYWRSDHHRFDEDAPEVVELSDLLRKLPLHTERTDSFRNPAGVSMKLYNIQYLDPEVEGGLPAGNRLEPELWDEFNADRSALHALADAIRANYAALAANGAVLDGGEDDEVAEGRILLRAHRARERNTGIVRRKKRGVRESTGCLECEVCHFDFGATYAGLSPDFIECHHMVPVSELRPEQKTKLADLALVCANCHRMLHYGGVHRTLDEVRAGLAK